MREHLLVGAGAVVGAFARWGLTLALSAFAPVWPLLAINFIGAALMGYFQPGPFWGKGVLGGFTSFSAFATATVAMTAQGAIAYAVLTVAGCIACYMAGELLQQREVRAA